MRRGCGGRAVTESKKKAWFFGLDAESRAFLETCLGSCELDDVAPERFEKILADPATEMPPCIAIVGSEFSAVPAPELAQFLTSTYHGIPVLYAQSARPTFEKGLYIKNGFLDTFYLAIDKASLKRAVEHVLSSQGIVKAYRPVKLFDVAENTVLDFNSTVYLPANQKYITFGRAGEEIPPEKMAKLKGKNIVNLWVPTSEMPKFYEYTAKRLREVGKDGAMSETERQEKAQRAVRGMITSVVEVMGREASIAEGRAVMNDCENIVKSYILGTQSGSIYDQIKKASDEATDGFSHSANVSTFAALFSIGTGIGKPEELALAGLIHDLGMVTLPETIRDKNPLDMTPAELDSWKAHVDATVKIVQERKLILGEVAARAVAQHHEDFAGSGFPKGLTGRKIAPEAQILAIADELDYRVQIRPGQPRVSPKEAMQMIAEKNQSDPGRMRFDPEILRKVVQLFAEEEAAKSA
ncbi:MAG: HD domain-containing protein [Bdellovibrionales bacterium]|nr:HD domain-containing protein [Bdellovibrionales bacterium]